MYRGRVRKKNQKKLFIDIAKHLWLVVFALAVISCPEEDDASDENGKTSDDDGSDKDDAGTGTEGSDTVNQMSTGCNASASSPAVGELEITIEGAEAPYIVTVPDSYDGTTPIPLVFAFHGATRTHTDMYNIDAARIKTTLGAANVMVYPKSQGGSAWTGPNEREINAQFFETLYEKMLADYCIDTTRVFAVGLSSGGGFTNILACRYGDILRGVGPVSGYLTESDCIGDVAAMVIHGERDSVVPPINGEQSRDHYLTRNGCADTFVNLEIDPCVQYEGCDDGLPVAWCQHGEPTYEDTNHGWPSFASEALAAFFASL